MSLLAPKSMLFPMLLVLYEIATYLSNDMYLPALPAMMKDLNLSAQEVQLTLTVWFIGLASMPLILGALSDRLGRRPVLLIGGFIFMLANIMAAVATDFSIVLVARVIQGGMVPSMMVAGYASIHELYEHKQAIRILALMSSVSVLAPAFGPLLGSFVLYFSTWHMIFWVIAAWTAIAILLLLKWMPETHTAEKRLPIHFKRLFQSYSSILTNRYFMLQLVMLGFLFGGFIAWITAGPLLIIETFHFSTMQFGCIQAYVFCFYILGNYSIDFLLEKIEIETLIRLGMAITVCAGFLIFAAGYFFPTTLYPFIVAMSFYSYGAALCFAPLNRLIIEASTEPMGIRVAMFTVLLMVFLAFASAMTSFSFDGTILSLARLITLGSLLAFATKGIIRLISR